MTTRYYFSNGWYLDSEFGPRTIIVDGLIVDNPDCRIPVDAVEVAADQYAVLLAANSQEGKTIAIKDGCVVAVDPPAPTAQVVMQANASVRDRLLASAALSIAPLQDADDLGMATDGEKALLTAWKKYRVDISRVDLTKASPAWPSTPAA
ncbi:tail fiber assembly protein [Burkholderia anthina]|uniref:tail fiber assembly protein n=1 Tax=Burkholderia anthina TaxID=179879 RepID=UPI00292EE0DE|nr:tail fiber assembly protein [Burkholderia anthina]WJN74355.1 Phage tail fiber protein [Burkholderia anthina]